MSSDYASSAVTYTSIIFKRTLRGRSLCFVLEIFMNLARSFSDRFSLESSGTFGTRKQTRSAGKSQRTPSKDKEPSHLRRSRRLEDRSRTKEKTRRERPKSRGKRSGHQETSRDSEYEEGSKDTYEDLNSPYKRPKLIPFTQRITCYKYHQRAKLPRNIRDKANVRPAWSGGPEKARNRGGLREARRNMGIYTPYPRKDTFTPLTKTPKEILVMESVSFLEPPPLIGAPKKQNLNKFCDYHGDRGHNTKGFYQLKKQIEEVMASGKLAHQVKEIRQNNQRNGSQGRNNVKVINMIRGRGNRKRPFKGERPGLPDELTFPAIPQNRLTDEPIILEGRIEDHQVRRILVDGGSSLDIMYEHCFRNLSINIRSRLRRCRAPLIGFSREMYHPLGIIDLRVTMGEARRNKTVLMEFAIVKCHLPYNVIIGRIGMRSLRAVGFTIHSMIKFPTNQGIMTMETSREALWECRQLERVQGSWKEVHWCHCKEKMSRIREQAILRTKSSSGHGPNQGPVLLKKTWDNENTEEILTISQERPNQHVTIGTTLTTDSKRLLTDVLWENIEVFA
ncbi:hypothetical protein Tco_0506514 [Tanacetum coccineum]